jgi:hypothetical protein
MPTIQRFVIDNERYVVDVFHPAGPKAYLGELDPRGPEPDQFHLRETILSQRLFQPVDDLIIDPRLDKALSDDTASAIRSAIYRAILASHLNTFDPALAIQKRFDGKLKLQKPGLQEITSLSLFCKDVERLLRDLYGDVDSEALEHTLRSVLCIVEEFARLVRKDLWQEHDDAREYDYCRGIGRHEGDGIGSSEFHKGTNLIDDLQVRARAVRENPSAFSKYTVEFANHWE